MIFDINVRKQNGTKIVQNSPAMIKRKKKSARITNEIRFMKGVIFMKSKMFYVGKLQTNSLQDPGEGNYFDKAIVNAANESKGICIQSYSAYANSTYLSYGTYWR